MEVPHAAFTAHELRIKFADCWGHDDGCDLEEGALDDADTRQRVLNKYCDWSNNVTLPYDREMQRAMVSRKQLRGSFCRRRAFWSIAETNVLVGLHEEALYISDNADDFDNAMEITGTKAGGGHNWYSSNH